MCGVVSIRIVISCFLALIALVTIVARSFSHGQFLQTGCQREQDGLGAGGNRPSTPWMYNLSSHDWLALLQGTAPRVAPYRW